MNHKRISEARKEAGLSQEQVAKGIGVSQATISRIEANEQEPSLQLLAKLTRFLGIELQEVLPSGRLDEMFGYDLPESFYAFCPNPFCARNLYKKDGGNYLVEWKSSLPYSMNRFEEVNFCPSCGTDLVKQCPNCGRLLETQSPRFCIACGTKITERPTEEEWEKIKKILDDREGPTTEDEIPF
jgi:putative transcriptional regulator